MKQYLESKTFRVVLYGIGVLVVALLVFQAGVFVGYHKAKFSYSWGETYERDFGGPHRGMMGLAPMPQLMSSHGISGTILSIGSSTIVVNGQDGVEKTVLLSSFTIIRAQRDAIDVSKLKINDQIVVIGSPNDKGQIEARLIRVF